MQGCRFVVHADFRPWFFWRQNSIQIKFTMPKSSGVAGDTWPGGEPHTRVWMLQNDPAGSPVCSEREDEVERELLVLCVRSRRS